MSSMPPNMPPNTPPGGGQPPYDPQTQWRSYREQQKAAWRAQRDQWRAQRHAWKANYVGMYGPRVPSMVGPIILVCIGRDCAAGDQRPSRCRYVLEVVRPLVAAASDRRGPGVAGRVGAGHAAQNSGAAQWRLHRDSDLSRVSGRDLRGAQPFLGPVPRRLRRRRLLQYLRNAGARQRSAGRQPADSGQCVD